MKKEFSGPRSHKGWETLVCRLDSYEMHIRNHVASKSWNFDLHLLLSNVYVVHVTKYVESNGEMITFVKRHFNTARGPNCCNASDTLNMLRHLVCFWTNLITEPLSKGIVKGGRYGAAAPRGRVEGLAKWSF